MYVCEREKEWENESECVQFSPPFVYIVPHHPRSKLLLFARYRFILMLSRCIRREKAIREKGVKERENECVCSERVSCTRLM